MIVAATLTTALVAGCSSTDTTEDAAATTDGWSYQDARGETIDLPATPTRIVTDAPSAAALIPFGITPVAIFTGGPIADDLGLQGLDLSGIEQAGDVFDEPNVETIARLDPDLVITGWYPSENKFGGISAENTAIAESVLQIAPIATVLNTQSASEMIADYQELASSLGADVESGTIKESREKFETAKADFQAAVASKPDLQVVALSPDVDAAYVANPADFPEFIDLTAWGLTMYTPPDVVARGYYSTVSWENVPSIPAGLVYYDNRFSEATPEVLGSGWSIWERYPAVAAGHTLGWKTETFNNYDAYTGHLDELTAAIDAT